MAHFTEKTIRANGQWVKITRDNVEREFTFAKGREGEYKAYDTHTLPFKWVANWTEALERAYGLTEF